MSIRLQILVEESEADAFRRSARREGVTLSEWARRALRRAQKGRLHRRADDKLRALDRALDCGHPTADLDDMLADIERGRGLR